jgi:hypothetical protein
VRITDFGGRAKLRARYWAVDEALDVASVPVAERGVMGELLMARQAAPIRARPMLVPFYL